MENCVLVLSVLIYVYEAQRIWTISMKKTWAEEKKNNITDVQTPVLSV